MTLLKDLIDIPERVQSGDFVLALAEGVEKKDATLDQYVVTHQIADAFDDAVALVRSAVEGGKSKAAYLHGSFGSGKSHFMAVLHLLLQNDADARSKEGLERVVAKHGDWMADKRFLLVPYHMIGAPSMEARVLGGYVQHVRKLHPDAPLPAVYLSEQLLADAEGLREKMGDDAFFAGLSEGQTGASGWGSLEQGWTKERYEAARAQGPSLASTDRTGNASPEHDALVSALIKTYFRAHANIAASHDQAMVSMDEGLAAMSRHAKQLGYDGLVLFLDELILWLATIASDMDAVTREASKLGKLVEAGSADRPIPIVSFVARQRDLREFIGDHVPGADKFSFDNVLEWFEGRFHTITLEDRNLPEIAHRRLLRPKTEAARAEIDAAFQKTRQVRDEVMRTLLTKTGDPETFRKIYPFSPAFMDTLVAVSSVLQRERTALKILMILLSEQRETLELGGVIPVGDLWDVIADGDEPFSPGLKARFDQAKQLYVRKLEPILERKHEVAPEAVRELPWDDPKRKAWRNESRLMKTLLLAALVTEVESLADLNAAKLAALNHGTIKTRIPGQEAGAVLSRVSDWGGQVGEVKLTPAESPNPTLSIHLAGVDTDAILEQASPQDNDSNRKQLVKQLLYGAFGVEGDDTLYGAQTYTTIWRGTKRVADVVFANVRDLIDDQLRSHGDAWRIVVDYPFDESGADEQADRDRISRFQDDGATSRTICWLPSYLDHAAMTDLGKLVRLDHILRGDRFETFASELSPQDRREAREVLTNQRDQLRQRMIARLEQAYGVRARPNGEPHVGQALVSLDPSFEPAPPVAPNLREAFKRVVHAALLTQFPAHPLLLGEDEVKIGRVRKVRDEVLRAVASQDGRIDVHRTMRADMKNIAQGLKLGRQGDGPFQLDRHWPDHFAKMQARDGTAWSVRNLRAWMDEPTPMGLPEMLGDLIILVFAAQTNRSFYSHGGPVPEADLLKLSDEFELREQELPDEETWLVATERLAKVFGITASPVCNAANVTRVVAAVRAKLPDLRQPAARVVSELTDRLRKLGLDTDVRRTATAREARDLVEKLTNASDARLVDAAGTFSLTVAEEVLARHLARLGDVRSALAETQWSLFESLSGMGGAQAGAAGAVLDDLEAAITADETATALGPTLRTLTTRAAGVLSAVAKSAPAPATTSGKAAETTGAGAPTKTAPVPKKGRRVVDARSASDLESGDAERELARIRKALDQAKNARLRIDWSVEGDA